MMLDYTLCASPFHSSLVAVHRELEYTFTSHVNGSAFHMTVNIYRCYLQHVVRVPSASTPWQSVQHPARRLTFIWEQQHAYLPPFCLHKSINLAQFASQAVASFSALHLLKHCKLYAAHPTALPAGPDADASFLASHPQHFLWFLSFNFCLCARAAVCLWWLRLTVRGFFTY